MTLVIFAVCFAASIVGAISGIGGGIIIKPVMDTLGAYSVTTINFLTSCTVFSMSAATLVRNRNSSVVLEKRRASVLAIGGIVGGLAGKGLFDALETLFGNDTLVGATQYILLIIITAAVLVFTLHKERFKPNQYSNPIVAAIIGILLGAVASFLGIGGGPINLAVLYLCFAMDSKTAALNSIYIILFSQASNILAVLIQGNIPDIEATLLAVMITGGIAGGITGSMISKRLTLKGVDYLFSSVMGVIILISIYNVIRFVR